jgi:hypothetical protein
MASSGKERKGVDLPGKAAPARDDAQKTLPDFDQVIEGAEISAEIAGQLQPQMGNEAIQALLAQTGSTAQGLLENEEQEEEVIQQEEEFEELELEVKAVGGGGGAGGAPSAPSDADPWDVGHLFGGDEDPEDEGTTTAKPKASPSVTMSTDVSPDRWAEESDEFPPDAFEQVNKALEMTPPRGEDDRSADSRFRAVEAALQLPSTIGRKGIEPESLVDRTSHLDPIGRPAAIGRFLSTSATRFRARVLARVLGGPASILVPRASGHAGATARLASLAICVEALEGGGEDTDRAVAVSLCRDVWPDAVIAARHVARSNRLMAPDILAQVRGPAPVHPETPQHSAVTTRARNLATTHLGTQALQRVVPPGFIPIIPSVIPPVPPASPIQNPQIAAADAALEQFIAGKSASDLPTESILAREMAQPTLNAATALINAMGRSQVEFAAAALAVSRVRPSLELEQTLNYADKALRQLARAVVLEGNRLNNTVGQPFRSARTVADHVQQSVNESASALRSLRIWAFSALIQEMNQ